MKLTDTSEHQAARRRSPVPRPVRLAALGLALCLAWSFALAAPAQALAAAHPACTAGQVRLLALGLLRLPARLAVAVGGLRALPHSQVRVSGGETADGNGGGAYPWEGAGAGGADPATGNKLTSLPLVAWTARGGLPVDFTLFHNSEGTHDAELGQKWTHTYDIYLLVNAPAVSRTTQMQTINFMPNGTRRAGASGQASGAAGATVHWGNDLAYSFAQSGSTFTPPPGIHDTLVANGSPVTSYDLTTVAQVRYHFASPNGSAWVCTSINDENGNALTIAYNAGDQVTTVTDPTGRALTLGYDGSGRVGTVTDPLGRVWTLSYNAGNQLAQVAYPPVGGATYTTAYGYDAAGDITSATDPRGETSTFGYNNGGVIAWAQDAAGNRTGYAYTSVATVTDPNGHATVYTYTGDLLSQVTDAGGYSEYYSHDGSYDKTQVEDKRGFYRNYTYDGAGNVLTAKDPYGNTTTSTYNGHNRPLTKTLPGGETTLSTYDGSDNLTQTQQKDSSGAVLATTSYTVSAATHGLVTDKYDPDGHHTQYGYGPNGDLTSLTTPLGSQTQWACDALGVRTSRTDAMGRATAYGLDGWERVASETYPDASSKTFSYDSDSDLTGFTDPTGATARAYDADGRLLTETKNGSAIVSHAYDGAGQLGLLSSTTDAGGRALAYAYTSRNQLASVSEAAGTTSYGYDAAGEETTITNGNGTTVAKVYDSAGRLASVTNADSSGTVLSSFSYAYNADSLKTSSTEADGSAVTYGYDGLLHLASEARTGTAPYAASYVVDGAGQRTAQTTNGVTTTLTYDADDELLSTSGGFTNAYGYNANGDQTTRTLSGTSYTLSYDYDDQLTSTQSGTGGASFTYDAAGRRVARTAGGVTTRFLYDGDSVLLEQQGGATTASYSYGNALTRKDGETPLFDGQGSERTVTDAGGAVQATLTLSAFGQAVASSGSSSDPYQYAATSRYRNDGDAGLALVGCRYYDAQVGAFISRDTYLDQRPYAYCDADPVNATDPSGHEGRPYYERELDAAAEEGAAAGVCSRVPVLEPLVTPLIILTFLTTTDGLLNKYGPHTHHPPRLHGPSGDSSGDQIYERAIIGSGTPTQLGL